jgi:hypothetical protein
MSEREEALNRDILFLMLYREPRLIKRIMKRWFKCLK